MGSRWMAVLWLAGCAVDGTGSSEQSVDEPITATVYKFGGDESGAPVVLPGARVDFVAPDHSVQTVYTDANGVASAVSPAGSQVVVYQTAQSRLPLVRTFYDTAPGDGLIVGYNPRESFPLLGTVTFSVPRRDPNSLYQVAVSCSSYGWFAGPVQDVNVYACPQATKATAVAWVVDQAGQYVTGPSVMRDLDLTQLVGSTVHMPGYLPMDLTSVSGQFVNLPSGTPYVDWSTGYLYDDDPHIFASAVSFQTGTSGTEPIEGVGNRTTTQAVFRPPGYGDVGQVLVEDQRSVSYLLDASNMVTPIGAGSFDFATQTFHWTRGTGRPASLVQLFVSVYSYTRGSWDIQLYAPGDATSLTMPALPPELTPMEGDSVLASLYAYDVGGEDFRHELAMASSRSILNPFLWQPSYTGSVWYANGLISAR